MELSQALSSAVKFLNAHPEMETIAGYGSKDQGMPGS